MKVFGPPGSAHFVLGPTLATWCGKPTGNVSLAI